MKSMKLPLHEEYQPWHPWCIQVELVQGCNRRCWFCGIRGVPTEKQMGNRYITKHVLQKTFSELNEWLPKIRVEINSHGEPTLHPEYFSMVSVIRQAMPSASISVQTNSETWKDTAASHIAKSFDVGVNTLIINAYKKGLYSAWAQWLKTVGLDYIDYYHDNPTHISANKYYPPSTHQIILWDDLGSQQDKINHVNKRLHNSGGNSDSALIQKMTGRVPAPLPKKARCSKVFRELILSWNGKIPICCQDWNDVQVMGNVKNEHIRDIWFGLKFQNARQLLYNRHRDKLIPCDECDDPTTRVGLIEYSRLLDE